MGRGHGLSLVLAKSTSLRHRAVDRRCEGHVPGPPASQHLVVQGTSGLPSVEEAAGGIVQASQHVPAGFVVTISQGQGLPMTPVQGRVKHCVWRTSQAHRDPPAASLADSCPPSSVGDPSAAVQSPMTPRRNHSHSSVLLAHVGGRRLPSAPPFSPQCPHLAHTPAFLYTFRCALRVLSNDVCGQSVLAAVG